jgi:hypothetical protein
MPQHTMYPVSHLVGHNDESAHLVAPSGTHSTYVGPTSRDLAYIRNNELFFPTMKSPLSLNFLN